MGHSTNCVLQFLAYDHYSLTVFGELQKDFGGSFIYGYNKWKLYVKVNSKFLMNNMLIYRKYDIFMEQNVVWCVKRR
jgi:trehalose-6-phosphate synthase